jgi:heme A synthase
LMRLALVRALIWTAGMCRAHHADLVKCGLPLCEGAADG